MSLPDDHTFANYGRRKLPLRITANLRKKYGVDIGFDSEVQVAGWYKSMEE